ncbi:MAG: hypothetical protein HOM36_01745 [Phycisphaerae bacterium]|nr:hypothetical protein [Phycisphaerae bacterium]
MLYKVNAFFRCIVIVPSGFAKMYPLLFAGTSIPMHYNTWPPIEVDVARFAPRDMDVMVMEPGDSVDLTPEDSAE